ncbi:tripartite motif-containing protein 2-like [Dysidea avara]|uniref:tripartite motif-containing protein 2-like n=1 Tax=Dysidea avara TaxID=196820 RepID=UPI00333291A9
MSLDGAKKDEWKEVEEEITCSICKEILTQPKTIPCLHTFCEQCIKSTIEASKLTGSNLSCPICRAELPQDVSNIPTNFSTNRLIEIYHKRQNSSQKTTEELKCGECDEDATVTMWCVDCESPLCGECYKQHGRMRKFKSHKTVTVENFIRSPKTILSTHVAAQPAEYCKDHKTQPLDLYCMTCSSLICRDCTYVDHREHQYNFVDKLADVEREKIKVIATPLKKMLEQVRDGLKKVEECDNEIDGKCEAEVIKLIRDVCQRLHEILQQEEITDLLIVDTVKSTLHRSLGSQIKELKLLEDCLVSCDEFVTKATTTQISSELLTYSKYISNRVVELTSQVERTNLEPVCGVDDLILSTSNPDDYVSQLTCVCSVSTLPHVPNCSVKGPAAMSKYGPVKLTVTLKDKDGLLVPNQSEHLRVDFKRESFTGSVKVEETHLGVYTLSYRPKRREAHSVSVSWKETVLKEVSILVSLRNYTTIQPYVQKTIDKYGPHGKQLTHPYMFAIGPNNELIVRDYLAKCLVVFDEQLQYSHSIFEGTLECPTGLAVNKKGYLYVAEYKLHCINKLTMSGKLVSRIGGCGSGDGQFHHPRSLLLSQSELLFVCDSYNHRIQVFQNDCYFYSFGEQGTGPGSFKFPFDLAMNNNEEQLFITDHMNHRVQLFTPAGQFISVFGNFTSSPYQLSSPTGICYTPDGHVLISSFGTDCVLIFNEDGNYVSAIEGAYQKVQRFMKPIGIVMRTNGQIVIASDRSCNLTVF